MAEVKETIIRIGILTRMLQRAECIEENEKIIDLELDKQTNLITLYIEVEKHLPSS